MSASYPHKNALRVLMLSMSCLTGLAQAENCQVQISPLIVDYGSFNPHVLRATARTSDTAPLGKRYVQLNVLCVEPQPLTLAFHGAAYGTDAYQLGDKGSFDLTLKDARLDGTAVQLGTVSAVGETPFESSISVKLRPGKYLVPIVDQQLKPGKALTMTMEIDARLATTQLKTRDVTVLNGEGYFEVQ